MKLTRKSNIALSALLLLSAGVSGCASVEEAQPAPQTEPEPVAEELTSPDASPDEGAMPALPAEPSYDVDDVLWIQQRLLELGYYSGAVDGTVGAETRAAVTAYQQDQGLPGDGQPTAELREFMWRNGG